MARISRLLADTHRVLRYDRRGYGRSWPHSGGFSVADQVDDVVSVLQGRRAVLFGHSYGGQVALAAAARLGEQIAAVATYETPLSWLEWWPSGTAGAAGVAAGPERAAEQFLVRLVGQKSWDALPERTKEHRRREGVALVAELSALREGAPWSPSDIGCTVRCGYGSMAREHHERGARWLAEQIVGASLVRIEGAGHNAHTTHARDVCDRLIRPLWGQRGD